MDMKRSHSSLALLLLLAACSRGCSGDAGSVSGFVAKDGRLTITPQLGVPSDNNLAASRTMAGMRTLAAAWEARATDVNKYNAAGALPGGLEFQVQENELDSVLSPTYVK